jgi:hypothetical protein
MIDLWCEKCKRETPHKKIGWGDYQGVMHEWYSCEVSTCYNEKVIAIGTQIHKGVFVQARRPTKRATDEKPAGASFMSKLFEAFRR